MPRWARHRHRVEGFPPLPHPIAHPGFTDKAAWVRPYATASPMQGSHAQAPALPRSIVVIGHTRLRGFTTDLENGLDDPEKNSAKTLPIEGIADAP